VLTSCRECGARVEEQALDEYGLMRCPSCRSFFHPRGDGFPWSWVIIGIIVAACLVKSITTPIQSVDAREGWHLRHD